VRIALVHDWLTGMRGGEKCLEVLCRRFPDARLFTLLHVPGSTSSAIERMEITTSFLGRFPGASRHYRYLLPLMPAAVERLKIPDDVDLVVSFSHAVAKSVEPPPGVPHVCYCFTPMRYAWHRRDDYFAAAGRVRNTPFTAVRSMVLDWIRHWDQATSDRVTHFVAISRTVARRIAESYGRPSRVIYPPVDTRFYTPAADWTAERAGPGDNGKSEIGNSAGWLGSSAASPQQSTAFWQDPYYLCVSALVPYKRIDLAIEACNRLRRRLVVIGSGPEERRLRRLAGPTVTLAGWRTNGEIREHLCRARALLFPANEDFGIVPLECQACGTPVIAFGQGGATETVLPADQIRQGTGIFFDRQTPESLSEAIRRLEAHPDWLSPSLARRQAERFATDRFERELVGYLEEVAASAAKAPIA
jgi:glycosyltransferase involved in cell wall biosynthesis